MSKDFNESDDFLRQQQNENSRNYKQERNILNDNIERDIRNTRWDSNIVEKSDLPDFEYDVDPPTK